MSYTAGMFRKKPVVIEAIRYMPHENCREVSGFLGQEHNESACRESSRDATFEIHTLEGTMTCRRGDWIIRGVNGEYYPCKADIFEKTYETVMDTYE